VVDSAGVVDDTVLIGSVAEVGGAVVVADGTVAGLDSVVDVVEFEPVAAFLWVDDEVVVVALVLE